jgi:hypothetical protein
VKLGVNDIFDEKRERGEIPAVEGVRKKKFSPKLSSWTARPAGQGVPVT